MFYDVLLFDLDGTLRDNYFTNIPTHRVNLFNELKKLYDIKIITDNYEEQKIIEQKINNDGIYCDVICPIKNNMNPTNSNWFKYDNAIYILHNTLISYNFIQDVLECNLIRVIEYEHTIMSEEYNIYPSVPLFYIGYIIDFFTKYYLTVIIEQIGKCTYDFTKKYKNKNVLMFGNALNDELFANNNFFSFINVNDKDIDDVLTELKKKIIYYILIRT
jgi:hypothetical protein